MWGKVTICMHIYTFFYSSHICTVIQEVIPSLTSDVIESIQDCATDVGKKQSRWTEIFFSFSLFVLMLMILDHDAMGVGGVLVSVFLFVLRACL